MLLVSAVDVALGWAIHTATMARRHWTLRREGALGAAALVALIGVADTVRLHRAAAQADPTPMPAMTASLVAPPPAPAAMPAQPPSPDAAAVEGEATPAGTPAAIPATPSPVLAEVAPPVAVPTIPSEPDGSQDAIARQLAADKPFTDPIATGSVRPRKVRGVRPVRRTTR